MATEILYPTGDSTPLEWSTYPTSPTTHYTKIDEVSADTGDYNWKSWTSSAGYDEYEDTFTLTNPSSSFTDQYYCSQFKVTGYCRYVTDEAYIDVYWRVNSGTWQYLGYFACTSSWASYNLTKTGLTYSDEDIDTLEIQVRAIKNPYEAGYVQLAQLNVEITYILDTITVINPPSGTQWSVGTQYNITWSKTGTIATFEIDLHKPSGTFVTTIANAATGTSYPWTVPSGLTAGTNYNVRIEDTAYSSTYDYSDAFEIIVSLPGLHKLWGKDTTVISKIMGKNDSNFDKLMNVDYVNT